MPNEKFKTTLSRREEISVRLAEALLSTGATTASGQQVGSKSLCLYAIECADAMIEEFDKKRGLVERSNA